MTEPYVFQKRGVRQIERFNGRVLLADEMGCGKTMQTLWYLKRNPQALPAVIVCPSTLKWVWEDEAKSHIRYPSEVFSGRTPFEKDSALFHPNILIFNYEIIEAWSEYILKVIRPKTLVIEECHYISNPCKRTTAVKALGRKVPHVIGISGTPLLSRPKQLFNIIHLIQPKLFPSYVAYAFRYCDRKRNPWGWDDNGASNLNELHKRLTENLMIRKTKKQVLKHLPDKVYQVIPLDIKKRTSYEKEKKQFITWLNAQCQIKDGNTKQAKKIKKSKGLLLMNRLLTLSSTLKMDSVMEWVDDFLERTDKKIVLFCHHVNVVETVLNRYKGISLGIYGGVPIKKRQSYVRAFQTQDKYRVLVANKAGAEGLTLTAAHHLAMIEMDWTPGSLDQKADRIHRIGQTETCFIYYLVARDTPEETMCKKIQVKQSNFTKIIDGENPDVKFDIYNEFLISVLKG